MSCRGAIAPAVAPARPETGSGPGRATAAAIGGELPSGLPYIVMERLDGSTLADWLAFHRRLPVPVVVEIGIQARVRPGA